MFLIRTVEAQTQLNLSSEKERGAVEKYLTLQSRVGAMETQLGSLRQEKSQLLATLELERAKLETLEEGQQRWGRLGLGERRGLAVRDGWEKEASKRGFAVTGSTHCRGNHLDCRSVAVLKHFTVE